MGEAGPVAVTGRWRGAGLGGREASSVEVESILEYYSVATGAPLSDI